MVCFGAAAVVVVVSLGLVVVSDAFEPLLLPKHARRFTAFDDSIVALYARGLTVREIQGFLLETYGTEVSADFISTVTDGIQAEVTAWQNRPLEAVYPVVFFDALRVKIRDDGIVRNKAVYLALGVRRDGTLHLSLQKKRDILTNNLYGVDIDRQAVEVAQLSLYLKLLEDETVGTTSEFQDEFHFTLLPSLDKNIVSGNSVIGPGILTQALSLDGAAKAPEYHFVPPTIK